MPDPVDQLAQTTTEVVVPVETPVVEPTRLFTPEFRQRYNLGDDTPDADIAAEFEELASFKETAPSAQELQQLRDAQQRYQQFQPHEAGFAEYLSRKQAEPQPETKKAQAVPTEDDVPTAPKLTPELEQVAAYLKESGTLVRDPATGLFKATDSTYADVAKKVNEFAAAERQFWTGIQRDPVGFFGKLAKKEAREVEKKYEERLKAQEEQFKKLDALLAEKTVQEDLNRNYQKYIQPTEDGQFAPTQYGQQYDALARYFMENMEMPLNGAHGHANKIAELLTAMNTQSTTPAKTEEKREAKKKTFLEGVRATRSKPRVDAAPTQDFQRSDRLRESMGGEPPTFRELVSDYLANQQ